jgi:hypothetical protein
MQKNNYKIEGDDNIDFFAELQKSLLENDLDEGEPIPVCQISGLPLIENHFKMNCGHIFNYSSLYTEICKQKFDFKTYGVESLTPVDLRMFRSTGLDYFIKCPYCRRIQTDLLPYYENLSFPKKYGVNTSDTSFRVMDSINHISNPANYTYKVYGHTFAKGVCCVTLSGIHAFNCFNSWVCEIPGLCKSYCPNHIRIVSKEYKLLEKEKIIKAKAEAKETKASDKALAKEKTALAKAEAKVEAKVAAKKTKVENKVITKTAVIADFVPDSEESDLKCSALLKSGPKKGTECGLKCVQNGFCGRHANK